MPGPACPPNKSWIPNAWKWILRNTPVLVSTAVIKHHDAMQLKKQRVISPHRLQPITKEVKAGQEPGGSNGSRSYKRTLLSGWLSLLLYSTQALSPGVAPPTVSCALPHQPSIKKILHRPVHRPIWWGHFLNWGPLSQMTLTCVKLIIQLDNTIPNIYF